jgi:phospholipase/carboxylesterase
VALAAGLASPHKIDQIVAVSGFIYEDAGGPESPPVLIIHGTQDAVVPVRLAQQTRDRLRLRGVNLHYLELDMGHELTPECMAAVAEFIGSR